MLLSIGTRDSKLSRKNDNYIIQTYIHKNYFTFNMLFMKLHEQKQGKEKGKIEMAMVRGVETVDDRALEGKSNVIQVLLNITMC